LTESPPSSRRHSQENLYGDRLHSPSTPTLLDVRSNGGSSRGSQETIRAIHPKQSENTETSSLAPGNSNAETTELPRSLQQPQRSNSGSALHIALFEARHEWPPRQNSYFIPVDALERLLHVDAIMDELAGYQLGPMTSKETHHLAQMISDTAPRLFALIVCLGLGDCIPQFLNDGINDDHLPFERSNETERPGKWKLCSKL
jgi:hypothetical protein